MHPVTSQAKNCTELVGISVFRFHIAEDIFKLTTTHSSWRKELDEYWNNCNNVSHFEGFHEKRICCNNQWHIIKLCDKRRHVKLLPNILEAPFVTIPTCFCIYISRPYSTFLSSSYYFQIVILRVVMLCNVRVRYRRFGVRCSLHLYSEVSYHNSARFQNSENLSLNLHHCEKLKFCFFISLHL